MGRELSNVQTRPETTSMALIALGSNLGNRLEMLRRGTECLVLGGNVFLEATSSLYASEPVDADGGEFLNVVIRVRTSLAPLDLLRLVKSIERDLGRTGARGDARTLDIDLLYFGTAAFKSPELEVPHPRRMQRPFVLVPLAEVCGMMPEPGTDGTIAQRIMGIVDTFMGSVTRIAGPEWLDRRLPVGRSQ